MLQFKLFFGFWLLVVLAAGVYLFKHRERLFGTDANQPSETSSGRVLNKVQVFVMWALAVKLLTTMLIIL